MSNNVTARDIASPIQRSMPSADMDLSINTIEAGGLNGNTSNTHSVSVAVDPVALITTECITVTSAMRKHARWAHSSVSAILGGSSSPLSPGFQNSRPPTPRSEMGSRRAPKRSSMSEGVEDAGLANRWGLRGKKGKSMQDNPLMAGFGRLRRELVGCKDIHKFDTPSLLHPFLQVIEASATSAPITSLALVAITKFFSYNLINPESPRLSQAMQSLSSAMTHCRFEASDSVQDEVVFLRILKLMEGMLSGPGGDLLSDGSVCEMMETGLSMCCQPKLSELIRRSAEMSMVKMCQIIFERLKHLEIEAGDDLEALDEQTKEDMDTVKMRPSAAGTDAITTLAAPPADPRQSSSSFDKPRPASLENASDVGAVAPASEASDDSPPKPYSLPSICELFRALIDLLDPHDRKHSDALRVMALRIINVALEVAGPSIAKHPALATLAEDRLCRYLFQLVRSDNMAILQESLIVAGTLLSTCREVLKLQQELFLSYVVACLHPRVEIPREKGIDPSLYAGVPQAPKLVKPAPSQQSSGRSTPVPVKDRQKLGLEGGSRKPDAREAMVESVGALARIPSYMVELFINYDCEIDRFDLCEDMVGLLSRNAIPDSATWSTTSVPPLCLDALLGYVQFIADRLEDAPKYEGYPDRAMLREQRRRKRIIIQGTAKFNENAKAGLAYLTANGIIADPKDAKAVVDFLTGTTRVSKKELGEFISKRGNEAMLEALMESLHFDGKRVDEALRELLVTFRLPGESALIERIINTFAEKYCEGTIPDDVADKDAVYVLTYAIIMLNTDQHNPNMKQRRMGLEDFARNLRGVNGGKDFTPEYVNHIFESIRDNEIILPEEHDNKDAFDYAWKELLLKTESAGDLVLCDTNIYDADMFASTWKPVVSTLSYVFMSASDDAVFERVIAGFDQCVRIAAKYGLTEVIDQVVYCLSYITTLATEIPSNISLNTEVQVGKNSVMVSELAVKFGRDVKAQLATVVLFRVVSGCEQLLGEASWKYIARIWLNLFVNSLIPAFFATSGSMEIGPIPLQNPSQVIDRGAKSNDIGLFSAFTSYISSYAADDPPEPSDEELESTLCTVDCVNACFMGDIFANIMAMPVESLAPLLQALIDRLPDDPSSVVISVKTEVERPLSPTNGLPVVPTGPVYDPSMVYILELCTTIVMRDPKTIDAHGKEVADALQNVIRNANSWHPLVVSRTIFYLLHLLRASYDHSYIRVPVVLHAISSFKKELFEKSAPFVIQGLNQCIKESGPLRNEMMTSPDFWVILRNLASNPQSAPAVFEILEGVAIGSPPTVMADNYESAVKLLNDFASAGSVGSAVEQKHDKRTRRGQPVKQQQPKPQVDAVVARGVKAITLISALTSRIPSLMKQSHLESKEAWAAYWSPIFMALTTQCTNPCREIRHQAFSSLQQSLLSEDLTSDDHEEWTAIFGEVLFPLITRLLKPEVYSSDPVGMSETRVQAATLLCRIFLHYLVLLSKWDGMLDLWLKILDVMDRLMNSGQGDSLEEAVPESLKNVLLVMSSSGYLVPRSQDPAEEKLWTETWKRIDRFLPDLRKDLDLDAVKENEVPPAKTEPEASPVTA
ncbi:Sec7 domain-containing protein [Rutstroemia sp. NJR-2017a WRK4]|nr:Sec7 domain-containing protein [Rutstroemia sp. NJR-2017a WRK4]